MSYNFDPDRWYDTELLALNTKREAGVLSDAEYAARLADLDRRYEALVSRLDGTFDVRHPPPLPSSGKPSQSGS